VNPSPHSYKEKKKKTEDQHNEKASELLTAVQTKL
jgi:hypothetical protein